MNLIFDYDGTLHDSAKIYIPAFRTGCEYLYDSGLAEYRDCSDEEIKSYLGFSVQETWDDFMPELPKSEQDKCSRIVGAEMARLTKCGEASLYDGAYEVLEKLKSEGFNLIFLSNCLHDYMTLHAKVMGLDKLFTAFYCSEDFGGKPKYEIFSHIQREHEGEFVVIGDRYLDLEIAKKHNLSFIGCTYGYGKSDELKEATALVSDVREIPQALKKILSK